MEKLYADVIIDISHEKLDRPFQYRIPEEMRSILEEGQCVSVPFGSGNRLRKGYVVAVKDTPDWDVEKIKEIAGIVPQGVSIEENQIRLAAFLKKNYGSTMIQAMKTVLPARQSVRPLENRSIKLLADEVQGVNSWKPAGKNTSRPGRGFWKNCCGFKVCRIRW